MKTPYDWLAKTYTNCYGHMTSMATMPIHGNNSLNLFFSGTKRPLTLGLMVCRIGDVGPTRLAQMMNLGWPWPTLWQGQIWFLMQLYGENLKMFIFYNWAEFIVVEPIETMVYSADLWPFIQGHSFGLPHTYLNIFFSEITGLFDGLFIRLLRSLDQNVYGKNKFVPLFKAVFDLDLF